MDGYIKKSEAVDVIVKYPYNIAGKTATAIKMIEDLPSADVVPRSEVSILTVQNMALENTKSELQHELNKYKGVENILKDNMGELIMAAIVQAKQELASEIFAEIDKNFILISIYDIGFKELKKKYTEGEG